MFLTHSWMAMNRFAFAACFTHEGNRYVATAGLVDAPWFTFLWVKVLVTPSPQHTHAGTQPSIAFSGTAPNEAKGLLWTDESI